MGFRETFVGNMRSWVGVPYVYGGARPLADAYLGQPTDCSGAVIVAAEKADPGCTGGASYTGDMRERFTATGRWTWHDGVEGLRPGDVVLTAKRNGVVGHTAAVDFDGGLLEEYPPQGRKVDWYGYPWDGYLSHVDEYEDGYDAVPEGWLPGDLFLCNYYTTDSWMAGGHSGSHVGMIFADGTVIDMRGTPGPTSQTLQEMADMVMYWEIRRMPYGEG